MSKIKIYKESIYNKIIEASDSIIDYTSGLLSKHDFHLRVILFVTISMTYFNRFLIQYEDNISTMVIRA